MTALLTLLAVAARPVHDLFLTEQPERTADGIVCGLCSDHEREFRSGDVVRHATVDHVRHCHNAVDYQDEEARQEIAAEQAVERFFEEGPHGGYYAGSPEEAHDRFCDWLAGR